MDFCDESYHLPKCIVWIICIITGIPVNWFSPNSTMQTRTPWDCVPILVAHPAFGRNHVARELLFWHHWHQFQHQHRLWHPLLIANESRGFTHDGIRRTISAPPAKADVHKKCKCAVSVHAAVRRSLNKQMLLLYNIPLTVFIVFNFAITVQSTTKFSCNVIHRMLDESSSIIFVCIVQSKVSSKFDVNNNIIIYFYFKSEKGNSRNQSSTFSSLVLGLSLTIVAVTTQI